ncbi:YadA family autotransporter adhesin [Psychrobacter sp.]|uniref:YadA family autotransporter adhesin n=1 Tax=Psychrobacter sp. TaxID=56811 RepID=UPI003BAF4109
MNRKPKTVLQCSIDCFATLEEYAKSRGKSSSSVVNANSSASAAVSKGARLLRLSALCAGLAAAGLSMQATAADTYNGDAGGPAFAGEGERLIVKGGANIGNLSDNNIGVIVTDTVKATNQDTLTIKLSKTLTGLESATFGGVTISTTGINNGGQRITNVAAGVTDVDAVNVRQLNAQGSGVANIIGGTTTYNPAAGTFTNANIGGTGKSTINDAIGFNTTNIADLTSGRTGVVREGTAATNNEGALSVGSNASATRSNSIAMGVGAIASGNSSISIGTGNDVSGNNSGAIGDPSTVTGNNSYSLGNNNNISGNRAFTVGNNNNISNNNSATLGNSNIINGNRSFALGNNNEINSNNAFALGNDIIIDANLNGAVGIGNDTTVAASNIASFDPTSLGGIVGTGTGSNVVSIGSVDIKRRLTNVAAGGADTDAVNVSQLRAVDGKVNTQGTNTATALGGGSTYDANTGTISAPTYTLNNGQNVFNNVGGALGNLDGRTISNTNNIAINASNIATNATNITNNRNAISDLTIGKTGIVQQNPVGNDNITIGAATGGTEVSFAGTQGDRVLTNVADGMAPRDAVNFGQLNGVERRLGNSINELGYRIDDVEDDANAGVSAAMAMSSLPQSNMAGRSMIGGGIATYNGESAVAVGISRVSDNGRWAMKINGTADTQGNAGGAIGAGFHF